MMHELLQRKLTTIIVADVVGYSRMVSADDERAVSTLKHCRTEIDKIIYSLGGRIFSTAGDSVLAEFPSTGDAVRASTSIQEFLRGFNSDKAEERQFQYRIGVHVGEVIIDGTDLLGDGVNIAARLAGVCTPGNVWISSNGLEFINKKTEFKFQSEGEHSVKNIPDPIEAYSVISPWRGQEQKILKSCRDMFETRLADSVPKVFQQVYEALFEVALMQSTAENKTFYAEAMGALKRDKLELEKAFCAGFLQSADEGIKPGRSSALPLDSTSIDVCELGLVGKEETDYHFSLNYITEKINSECYNEIFALDNRVSALVGKSGFKKDENPFGPKRFRDASKVACDQLDVGINIKTVILRVLAIKLNIVAKPIYSDINEFLVSEGVLPTVRPVLISGPIAPTPQATIPAIAGPMDIATQQQLVQMVGQLISTGQLASSDFVHLAKSKVSEKTIHVLDQAQHGEARGALSDHVTPEQLSSGTSNILHRIKSSPITDELDAINAEILGVVASMFDLILDDSDIPDQIKTLVARLQIPILKVTLIDKTFFSEDGHPAKELLNSIVTASTDLIDDDWQGVLYEKVKDIVVRINQDFSDDIQIFVSVVTELNKFISGERRQARYEEAETAAAIENQELTILAQRKTSSVVEQRLTKVSLPLFVYQFIRGCWTDLLMLTYIKEGETGNGWRTNIDTLDDLVWSISSERTHEDRKRLLALIPNLVSKLKNGMDFVGAADGVKKLFLSTLKEAHIETIQLGSSDRPVLDSVPKLLPGKKAITAKNEDHGLMSSAIKVVNEAVFCAASSREDCDGMLTTLVVVQTLGERVIFSHVGDSRLYLLRNKEFTQLTVDHTVKESLLKKGYRSPLVGRQVVPTHILSRSIGGERDLEIEVQELLLEEDDLLVACSDGLYAAMDEDALVEILVNEDGDLDGLAASLVNRAMSTDGKDNVTVALMALSGNMHNTTLSTVTGSATECGVTRSHNEDFVLVDDHKGIVVLAGGMGGGKRGQVASHIACNLLMAILKDGQLENIKQFYSSDDGKGNCKIDIQKLYSDLSDDFSEKEELPDVDPIELFESKWSDELEETEITGLGDLFETPDDKYLMLVKSLKVGSWVEFRSPGGITTQARVSWISPRASAILFTDVRGARVCVPSLKSLANELRVGSARIIGMPIANRIENYIRHLGKEPQKSA